VLCFARQSQGQFPVPFLVPLLVQFPVQSPVLFLVLPPEPSPVPSLVRCFVDYLAIVMAVGLCTWLCGCTHDRLHKCNLSWIRAGKTHAYCFCCMLRGGTHPALKHRVLGSQKTTGWLGGEVLGLQPVSMHIQSECSTQPLAHQRQSVQAATTVVV